MPRFKQIISHNGLLTALSENGEVFVYAPIEDSVGKYVGAEWKHIEDVPAGGS